MALRLVVEKAREKMARMAPDMLRLGLAVGTWGNFSCRVTGENLGEDLMVITPSGVPYTAMKPRDMVVMRLDGEVVDGDLRPSTEWRLHAGIYRVRRDVNAVVHTHSPVASGLAVARLPLPPILEDVVQIVGGEVPVAAYATAGTEELAANTAAALRDVNGVLLANHGVVGVGQSLEDAFTVCQVIEKGAQVYVFARLVGEPTVLAAVEVDLLRRLYRDGYGQPGRRCGG
ncbi:MAG: class II aldolase/adducin family protein [Desulfotomaculales bacterium]